MVKHKKVSISSLKKFLLAFLFVGFFTSAQASVLLPAAEDYYILNIDNYSYILPEEFKVHLPELVGHNRYFTQLYQENFHWRLDERASLILTSNRHQIANGYATVMPNLKTVFYPGGSGSLDRFGTNSWIYTLLSHETAHLYQLNVKRPISSYAKAILGNTMLFFLPFGIPLFIHPNVFTPTYLTEGNAVFNESRFGLGGRLYSGEIRALAFNAIKADLIKSPRLINDHLNFPFGAEKYETGGYLNLFLAEKYGQERPNLFFAEQSEHFIYPLVLNDTYRYHFKASYNQVFKDFSESFKKSARHQRQSQAPILFSSLFHSPFNHDSEKIFFLISKSGRSDPELIRFNKTNKTFDLKKMDLSLDKVFETSPGQFSTASSARINLKELRYSLFEEGLYPLEKYNSKIVQDLRANQLLWINPETSMVTAQLFKNDQFLATIHSTAILDDKGRAIFFMQDKDSRRLMREQEVLTEFQGFYSKPLEALEDGSVLFIANTPLGSSLFKTTGHEIFRLSPSDLIVDARLINANEALICEVTVDGYLYKIENLNPYPSKPADYDYEFEKQSEFKLFQSPPLTSSVNATNLKSYNSFRDIRYSATNLNWGYSSEAGLIGSLQSSWTDPLEFHNIQLGVGRSSDETVSGMFSYTHSKWLIAWEIGYEHEGESTLGLNNQVLNRRADETGFLKLKLPLLARGHWQADFSAEGFYNENEGYKRAKIIRTGAGGRAEISRSRAHPLSFDYYRNFTLGVFEEWMANENGGTTNHLHGVDFNLSGDLGYETFLSTHMIWSKADQDSIRIAPTQFEKFFYEVPRFTSGEEDANEVKTAGVTLKKVINGSHYFSRFPISLRRYAPFLQANYYDTAENSKDQVKEFFWETAGGLELELLLLHKIPIHAPIMWFHDTKLDANYFQITFSSRFEY